jgi:hypothetical protein
MKHVNLMPVKRYAKNIKIGSSLPRPFWCCSDLPGGLLPDYYLKVRQEGLGGVLLYTAQLWRAAKSESDWP